MSDDSGAPIVECLVLIDDNEIDLLLHRRIVERAGLAARVVQFQTGEEALGYLGDGGAADLILLDINMPRMDGFAFLDAALERLGPEFATVVMMLTTSMDPADRQRASTYEVVKGYLEKPLSRDSVPDLIDILKG